VDVRRVVTGKTVDGKSVFISDDQVAPVTLALSPGYEFHQLWWGDATPQLPIDGTPPERGAYFPPPAGFRFGFFTVAPGGQELPPDVDIAAGLAEIEAKLPGMAAHMEPEEPGMHTTQTVDFEVVLSGEVVCELDDGAEVTLRAGDTFVQNGTRHRWHNRTDAPAVLFVALIGANPAS
jgi:mannose-6-phosphate isomerase-like protein (cupin superfamily)